MRLDFGRDEANSKLILIGRSCEHIATGQSAACCTKWGGWPGRAVTLHDVLSQERDVSGRGAFRSWIGPAFLPSIAEQSRHSFRMPTISGKSGDTCGNFLRLVRPTGPCSGKLASTRRKHPFVPVSGTFRGISGSCLRPAPLERLCIRRHVAIARTAHLGPHGCHPVQLQ